MALSLIGYVNQAEFVAPSMSFLQQTLQSADPDDMKAKFDAAVAEVAALNVLILDAFPEDPELQLSFADASLAGGGDGHTFTLILTWVPVVSNQLAILTGVDEDLLVPGEGVNGHFCLASTAQALNPAFTDLVNAAALEDAQSELLGITTVWQAHAGASQGTRFMAGIIDVPVQAV